jgi:hypothetical protein
MNIRESVLGVSWIPSLLGVLIGVGTELQLYLKNNGMPQTGEDWLQAAIGILVAALGASTKQWNVTNASTPKVARAVKEAVVDTPTAAQVMMVDK